MQRRQVLLDLFKVFDLACITFGIYFCIWISKNAIENYEIFLPRDILTEKISIHDLAILFICLIIWHTTFNYFRLYTSRRLSTFLHELVDIFKATLVGCIAILIFLAIVSKQEFDIYILLLLWSLTTLITVASRFLLRITLHQLRRYGRNKRKIIIVGTNSHAVNFAKNIKDHEELGYDILGFVDNRNGMPGTQHEIIGDIVSTFDDLPEYFYNNTVDEVAVFFPLRSHYDEIRKVIYLCEEHGIIVRLRTNIIELKLGTSYVDNIADEPLVTIYTGNMQGWKMHVKRVFDFFASLLLLICFAPLFIVITILIKKDSPGPVFFFQERIGLNKKRFKMIKFRTMEKDAEQKMEELEDKNEAQGPVFKIKNDPRSTAQGKFLRNTSIDELPQLFNILKGDMSLVGPRPLPVRDYNLFNLDWHRRRFSVRPGITCLWQISGRSDLDFDEWMELDMKYIDSWSLSLDFKILLRTIPCVLNRRGAV
jgi:exopolysaccharide biosynthesis polyprenyl glycosylphosphotransferase